MKNHILAQTLCCLACLVGSSHFLGAATTNVSFGSFFFNPNDVTIQVGDTVVWNNTGGSHTVTGTGADPICGVDFVPISCSHTFNTAGEFPYICTVTGHAALGMTGIVRVVSVPITSAQLSNPELNAQGQFEFTVSSTANHTNVIQATTDAANPSAWTPVATVVPTSDTFQFTDTNTGGFQLRFYRVVQPD